MRPTCSIRSSLLFATALLALDGCTATAEKIDSPWDAGTDGVRRRDRGSAIPDYQAPDFGDPDFGPRRDTGAGDSTRPDARPHSDFAVFPDTGKSDGPARDASGTDGPACSAVNDACTAPKKLTWSGMTIAENGDTGCAKDDLDFELETCGDVLYDGTMGPDVFYEITLPAGSYRVSLDAPTFDAALYVLKACDVLSCVAASDELNAGVLEALYLQVGASTKYLVGVDSYDPAEAGAFKLVIEESALPPDAGPTPDATPPDAGPAPDGPPSTGTVVITEMLINPGAVADTAGEWFEVYNAGAGPVNLKGWQIRDQPGTAQQKHTIASDAIVPPGGYLVLGRGTNLASNGGAPVTYAYASAFDLANGEDEIFLYDAAGALVDQVAYTAAWWTGLPNTSAPSGVAMSLKNPTLDNSVAASWCQETAAWSGSAGDKGTPGAAGACQ